MTTLTAPRHCHAFTCAPRDTHDSDSATGVARSDEGFSSVGKESVDSWTPGPKPLCHRHPTGPHPSGLLRTPWTPAKGDSTESDFALAQAFEVGAPAAESRDVVRRRGGIAFADEALHGRAVFQLDRAEAERRGDLRHEVAETPRRQAPDLERDRAAAVLDAHQARPLRRAAGQRIEPVVRCGPGRELPPAAALGELAVERQA